MARWGKVEIKGMKDFAKQMQKAAAPKTLDRFYTQLTNDIANEVLKATVKNTPVKSGQLRRSWQRSNAKKWHGAYVAEIYNNVRYAPWVENGHRIVRNGKTVGFCEGKHMLRNAMQAAKEKSPDLIAREQQKFLQKLVKDDG